MSSVTKMQASLAKRVEASKGSTYATSPVI
jgi:hypothetical protein